MIDATLMYICHPDLSYDFLIEISSEKRYPRKTDQDKETVSHFLSLSDIKLMMALKIRKFTSSKSQTGN